MAIPVSWRETLRLPVLGAPMFLVSGVDLVLALCRAGVVGCIPALNARSTAAYDELLGRIAGQREPDAAPFGVNLVVHRSNGRLAADLAVTVDHRVPLVITSLGAAREVVDAVHAYGGLVFHDVTTVRHAQRAAEAGVDGLIAVCAGAGGHAGLLSPFAFVAELRRFFGGTLVLSGAISSGADIAAARAMGADLAYIGTRFLATRESLASDAYKQMVLRAGSADIVHSDQVSGVPASFLRESLLAAGLDRQGPPAGLDMSSEAKLWRDIWSAGQGVGAITDLPDCASLCRQLAEDYAAAAARLDWQS
jgi:nitronate monooxygenase